MDSLDRPYLKSSVASWKVEIKLHYYPDHCLVQGGCGRDEGINTEAYGKVPDRLEQVNSRVIAGIYTCLIRLDAADTNTWVNQVTYGK